MTSEDALDELRLALRAWRKWHSRWTRKWFRAAKRAYEIALKEETAI